MKLKTSFCNVAVLKKNFTRFAPAWVLYGVFWLLLLLTTFDNSDSGPWFASSMAESLQFTNIINMAYAFLCAQLLFGDLFNSRMCNALHAMPLRRETWFASHVASGILFSVLPNLILMLISATMMGSVWITAPIWFLVNTLQFLFFFGVAVFSAFCVGNRFAMALVYIIINGFSVIAYWLLDSLYAPQLYGIIIDETPFTWLCPVFSMTSERVLRVEFSAMGHNIISGPFLQLESGFWYVLICAGIGLVFMTIGLLLYRKRNLECAGDFMSIKAFDPIFLILYCLCGGAVGYMFFNLVVGDESIFFLLIGMLVGWFTGRMLLERTVRVFRMKNFIGCGILLLIFFGSLLLTHLDPLGITRWVPRAGSISGVHIRTGGSRYDYYLNGNNYLEDAADIEAVLAMHRYGITHRNADYNGTADVALSIDYQLKSGISASRDYVIDLNTPEADALQKLMSRPQIVLGAEVTDAQSFADTLILMRCDDGDPITGQQMVGLIEAILKDCAEGNMAQDWSFHNSDSDILWLTMQLRNGESYHEYRDIRVYDSCAHTRSYLKDNGLLPEINYKYGN